MMFLCYKNVVFWQNILIMEDNVMSNFEVKCEHCGKVILKNDSIVVKGMSKFYMCFCSKKCLVKYIIDKDMEE